MSQRSAQRAPRPCHSALVTTPCVEINTVCDTMRRPPPLRARPHDVWTLALVSRLQVSAYTSRAPHQTRLRLSLSLTIVMARLFALSLLLPPTSLPPAVRAQMHLPRAPKLHPMRSSVWSLNSTKCVSSQSVQPGYSLRSTDWPRKCLRSLAAYAAHSPSPILRAPPPAAAAHWPPEISTHGDLCGPTARRGGGSPGTKRASSKALSPPPLVDALVRPPPLLSSP